MLELLLYLSAGFLLLSVGAEMVVSGSSRLALRWKISPLLVGLTVVAFGTSAPELAVSIQAAANDLGSLALGNVIGSNIANIGLVLGITALIKPIRIEQQLVRRQIPLVIATSLLLGILMLDSQLGAMDGVILTVGLALFLLFDYRQAYLVKLPDTSADGQDSIGKQAGQVTLYSLLMLIGLALLLFGSRLFVASAGQLAQLLNVSEAVIGLTLVAVGTSVPELATSLVALRRNQADIAIGNVIGSNIFNILCVLGITGLVATLSAAEFSLADFAIMLLFSLVLLPLARSGLTLSRIEGVFLLAGYLTYLGFISQHA